VIKLSGKIAINVLAAVVVAGCVPRGDAPPIPLSSASGYGDEMAEPMVVGIGEPGSAVRTTRARWEFASYPGVLITTPSYRIYTTVDYDHVVDRLPVLLEDAVLRYRTALAELPPPPRALELYLFQDRRQWTAKTRQVLPDHAASFDNLGRGGYSTRGTGVLYYIDRGGRYRDTFALAAHEGWHQYTQVTFKQPLPIWLEEGIATYMEGIRYNGDALQFEPSRNWERRGALARAMRYRRLIPLDDLLSRTPQSFLKDGKDDLLTYYAQVWALTRFLADGADGRYRAALGEVLRDAATGRLHDRLRSQRRAGGGSVRHGSAVITAYFNDDLAAFEAQFNDYARRLATAGPSRGWRSRRNSRR
jgi:hypothetical protein